jgi:hypothetical protein
MPEPGPVGVRVDPLGEPLGASVLPEGLVVVFGPVRVPEDIPVVEPGGFPTELPPMDEPVLEPVEEPPTLEPAPDVPPPLVWANAIVLESAKAPASAMVVSFMVVSLVNDQGETGRRKGCSSDSNTKTSATGNSYLFATAANPGSASRRILAIAEQRPENQCAP